MPTPIEETLGTIVYAHIFGDARPQLNCQPHELVKELEKFMLELEKRGIEKGKREAWFFFFKQKTAYEMDG